ncbi:rhomboid family intramembrane serine protease [Aquisalimonas asiatica]|uniref:Membrane associated serine protease, rhomboid family n=1 Tax=Aquisalimonas asiatica TaxID=406100 RepID=A0A1H8QX72_9GAMM|nr:rhomboid family intramembrane serine protease [Aquisalimonas asiatica]SEO58920.1 Membrane associated serine protease, rhomboid family [Aquisalimonas asiatica]
MIPVADDNPTRIAPVVTWALLAACIGVFFWQIGLDQRDHVSVLHGYGFIPAVFFDHAQLPPSLEAVPVWVTPLSSMFLHGGWMHLISNMLYLWVFANNVEDAMGHGRFIIFYALCGILAALAQGLAAPESQIPMIGASGAISGVLGAYLMLHPFSRITVIIPLGIIFYPVRLPAGIVLVAWFGLQLLSSATADPNEPGVAFLAHIGGFVAGMLLIPLFKFRRVRLFRGRTT